VSKVAAQWPVTTSGAGMWADIISLDTKEHPLPATFHVKMERVWYINEKSGVVVLGTSTFEWRRKKGDGEAQIKKRFKISKFAPRADLKKPAGTIQILDSIKGKIPVK